MGGVQFAFLTLPSHSQRELCIVMLGTGCKFFRIFIVGAVVHSYTNLLRPHILQTCLSSVLPPFQPSNLPIHNSLPIDPSNHLPTCLPSYTHTHTYSILQAKVRTSYCRPYDLSFLSVPYSGYCPKIKAIGA
jgi:hypothetical protein